VHALEQSAEVVSAAQRHAEMNDLANRCTFEACNVFDWLKARTVATKPDMKMALSPQTLLSPMDPSGEGGFWGERASSQRRRPGEYDMIILDPPSFTRNRAAVPDALRGYKEIHLRAIKLLRPRGTLVTFCCSHHVDAVLFQEVILAAAYDARRILRRIDTYTQAPDHPVIPSIPESEYLKGYAFELA
jgi:23S rRNA (cytosine1962-C5)-methyltransferase